MIHTSPNLPSSVQLAATNQLKPNPLGQLLCSKIMADSDAEMPLTSQKRSPQSTIRFRRTRNFGSRSEVSPGGELLQADDGEIVSQSWREEFGVDPEEPPTRIYF